MFFTRRWFSIVCLMLLIVVPASAQAQDNETAKLWDNFLHYVMVARPDLAQSNAAALLEQSDPSALLDVVEASDRSNEEILNILDRAKGMPEVRQSAIQLEQRIQDARITRSREVDRILEDIEKLGGTRREYLNAVTRLRGAGQFAVPHMLRALQDGSQSNLHPYLMSAMVAIGQPVVYPLVEALPNLESVTLGQVARVLGDVGYPTALPALKGLLEKEGLDPNARSYVESAYNAILQNMRSSSGLSAAELHYMLAVNQYAAASNPREMAGYDHTANKGIVWRYTRDTGLVPVPVPGQVYGDVMAMRSAKSALSLNPGMNRALTMWVMANLRRENNLQGEADPSYPQDRQVASFYAHIAGPERLQEVLARALTDQDAELALDAISALAATAGPTTLGQAQPLINALSFSDRRVRYSAAFALSISRPTESFEGAFRVVPVLAQAVRQGEMRQALVISDSNEAVNQINAVMRDLEYQTVASNNLASAGAELRLVPGIDLIVLHLPVEQVETIYAQTLSDYKLSTVPILALTNEVGAIQLNNRFHNSKRIRIVNAPIETGAISQAVQNAGESVGQTLSAEQATEYALTALQMLRDIAISNSAIYNVVDAQPALTQALTDEREAVAQGAGRVLALINNSEAQQSLFAVALDNTRSEAVRLSVLDSLAESATAFGNMLTDRQESELQNLVATGQGDLAVAAARAFGALTLATPQAVELIVR